MFDFTPSVNQCTAKILSPVLKFLYLKCKLTPNRISILSFTIGSISVILILFKNLKLGLLFLLAALIFDVLDGAVARYFKLETKQGKILELIFDRTNEASLFLAIAYVNLVDFKTTILAIVAILLMTTIKDKSKFDPGCKRIMLFVGYLLHNFKLALEITFFVNLFSFILSMLIIEYKNQKKIDCQSRTCG
ncbi:MAG: CDP-alcohol phosphatidyltransferase family protein [Patescibacteria group bacterium]